MDGIHDLGGIEGFGPITVADDEPVFHREWERRMWGVAMSTFMAGLSNGGQFRHSIERMDAVHYLTSAYYEHWFTGIATRAVEEGLIALGDLEARAGGAVPLSRPVHPDAVAHADLASRERTPDFRPGDEVRVVDLHTRGHTRCPRYVRGRRGNVVRVDRAASVPDLEAHSDRRESEPIYCVRFSASELWGANDNAAVHVDLWARYLEAT